MSNTPKNIKDTNLGPVLQEDSILHSQHSLFASIDLSIVGNL